MRALSHLPGWITALTAAVAFALVIRTAFRQAVDGGDDDPPAPTTAEPGPDESPEPVTVPATPAPSQGHDL